MPPIRRTIKKTTYAILFALLFAIPTVLTIVPGIIRWRQRQARPVPERPIAIQVESVDAVLHPNNVDIIARIRNPNPRAGVPEFTVSFVLLDEAGSEIERLQEQTYLLPGSLNYIAALAVPLASTVAQVRVETPPAPQFTALPQSLAAPAFNSFLRGRTERMIGSKTIEVQKGIVTNTSTLGFQQVDVTGVAFAADGQVVGIGQTFIGKFSVGEQREFTIEWPKPAAPTERVIIFPTSNIFREDNILRPEGDPSLLR
ncbi:MAG: hypothetical protein HY372_01355 [Candidatus Andersenbacteria bacterium]|nr:hypothetical protein [Candidatus Andersenbacteria bacterium]